MWKNSEGYTDPTAGQAVCNICKEQNVKTMEVISRLIHIIKQTAEFIGKYMTKGRKVVIEGAVRTRNYEDQNGNKRKATEIQADRIEFADSQKQQEDYNAQN